MDGFFSANLRITEVELKRSNPDCEKKEIERRWTEHVAVCDGAAEGINCTPDCHIMEWKIQRSPKKFLVNETETAMTHLKTTASSDLRNNKCEGKKTIRW